MKIIHYISSNNFKIFLNGNTHSLFQTANIKLEKLQQILSKECYELQEYDLQSKEKVEILIIFDPLLVEGEYLYISPIWRKFLLKNNPESRLLIAGIDACKHPCYLDLFNPPNDILDFLNELLKIKDFEISKPGNLFVDAWENEKLLWSKGNCLALKLKSLLHGHDSAGFKAYEALNFNLQILDERLSNLDYLSDEHYQKIIKDFFNDPQIGEDIKSFENLLVRLSENKEDIKFSPFQQNITDSKELLKRIIDFLSFPPQSIKAYKASSIMQVGENFCDILQNKVEAYLDLQIFCEKFPNIYHYA